jgi:hypothetical protein
LNKATAGVLETPELSMPATRRGFMSTLRDKKGLSTSISESLGALAMGVMVLALVGVGIGAGYNYSQDASAKSSLDAVQSAEVLHQARAGAYGTDTQLTAGADPAMSSLPANLKIAASTTNYCAVVKSGSMFPKTYWVISKSNKILEAAPALADSVVACPTV